MPSSSLDLRLPSSRRRRLSAWMLVSLAVLIAVTGTLQYYRSLQERPHLNPSPSPAWSRAMQLGSASLINAPALTVDARGRAFVVWVGNAGEGDQLFFAQVDEAGRIAQRRAIDLQQRYPQYPHLVLDAQDQLHLSWIDGSGGTRQVHYVRLDASGRPLLEPAVVSGEGVAAGWADLVVGDDGDAVILWSGPSARDRGLYISRVSAQGQVTEMDAVLDPLGVFPTVQRDARGSLHMAWLRSPPSEPASIVYATWALESPLSLSPHPVASLPVGANVQPVLGLDREHVYTLWQQKETRLDGSTVEVVYLVSFPTGHPEQARKTMLELANPPGVNYRPADDPGPIVAEPARYPAVSAEGGDRAYFATSVRVSALRHGPTLLVQGILEGGRVEAYRQANAGRQGAVASAIRADAEGELHLVWLEMRGESDNTVRYASTAPGVAAVLSDRTRQDVREALSWAALALVATLAFSPLILLINGPVLGLLTAVVYWKRGDNWVSWRYLAAAVAIQTFSYVGFGQALVPSETFADWLPRSLLAPATMYLYPLTCVAVGVAAMLLYRRRQMGGAIASYLAFALASGWSAVLALFYYLLPRL